MESKVWWLTPVTAALRRQRPGDHYRFMAITVSSMPEHQEHKFSYLKMSRLLLYQFRTSFCVECLQKHQSVSVLVDSEMGKRGTGLILKAPEPSFHLRSSQELLKQSYDSRDGATASCCANQLSSSKQRLSPGRKALPRNSDLLPTGSLESSFNITFQPQCSC